MLMHKREEVYGKFNNLNIFYARGLMTIFGQQHIEKMPFKHFEKMSKYFNF